VLPGFNSHLHPIAALASIVVIAVAGAAIAVVVAVAVVGENELMIIGFETRAQSIKPGNAF